LFENSKKSQSENTLNLDESALNAAKQSIASLVNQSNTGSKAWSYVEMASFLFGVYHMGENDWK
jgi:hypothetical protein